MKSISAFCLAITVGMLLLFITHKDDFQNKGVESLCWADYTINQASGPSSGVKVSDSCRAQVDAFYEAQNVQVQMIYGFYIVIVFGIILTPIYAIIAKNWVNDFCLGIQKLTNGYLSGMVVAFLLSYFSIGTGIALVQQRINVINASGALKNPANNRDFDQETPAVEAVDKEIENQ